MDDDFIWNVGTEGEDSAQKLRLKPDDPESDAAELPMSGPRSHFDPRVADTVHIRTRNIVPDQVPVERAVVTRRRDELAGTVSDRDGCHDGA